METTQLQTINNRKERGLALAKELEIRKIDDRTWRVTSQTNPKLFYTVKTTGFNTTCTCRDYQKHNCNCKHIYAVEYKENNNIQPIQETTKPTYTQDWNRYDRAQKEEKEQFLRILADAVKNIETEQGIMGRPKAFLNDVVYSMIFKVYSGLSGRRFTSDMRISREFGYIEKDVPFSTLRDYFNKEETTELLQELVMATAQPLNEVETDFAIDSSGFGTSTIQNWSKYKHSTQERYKKWLKCHIVCGVKTNVISAVNITSEFEHDSPQLKELLEKTNKIFNIREFSADKAYSSRDNLKAINQVGATPYIPFKKNVTLTKTNMHGMFWKKALHYFLYNQEEFMQHYHKRSNVETTFSMIKKKFGETLKCKNWTSQVNELLCKVICHNICVLISELDSFDVNLFDAPVAQVV